MANASVERGKCCYQFQLPIGPGVSHVFLLSDVFVTIFYTSQQDAGLVMFTPRCLSIDDVELKKNKTLCVKLMEYFLISMVIFLASRGKGSGVGRCFGPLCGAMIKETRCCWCRWEGLHYTPPKFNSEFAPEK